MQFFILITFCVSSEMGTLCSSAVPPMYFTEEGCSDAIPAALDGMSRQLHDNFESIDMMDVECRQSAYSNDGDAL